MIVCSLERPGARARVEFTRSCSSMADNPAHRVHGVWAGKSRAYYYLITYMHFEIVGLRGIGVIRIVKLGSVVS